jgi:hypothetical protein
MMSRSSQIAAVALAWAAFVTVALSWVILGDTQTPLPGLPNPGPLVTRGLPVFDVIAQLFAIATVGFLMVAVFPTCRIRANSRGFPFKRSGSPRDSPGRGSSRSIMVLLATVADINGLPMWNVSPAQVWYFLRRVLPRQSPRYSNRARTRRGDCGRVGVSTRSTQPSAFGLWR